MKLFYTGPVINTEMLVVMLEKHGIAATQAAKAASNSGAVAGDFLDKPRANGGLALSRYSASAALLLMMAFFIFSFSHKPAKELNPKSPGHD